MSSRTVFDTRSVRLDFCVLSDKEFRVKDKILIILRNPPLLVVL